MVRKSNFMNNEKMNQIVDEAYENYLENLISPTCPPNLDVQPNYYEPMSKDWFVKSAKERGLRGDEFSEKWGLKIEERELSLDERYDLMPKITGHSKKNIEVRKHINNFEGNHGYSYHKEWIDSFNIPTRLITITYNNETIEIYE